MENPEESGDLAGEVEDALGSGREKPDNETMVRQTFGIAITGNAAAYSYICDQSGLYCKFNVNSNQNKEQTRHGDSRRIFGEIKKGFRRVRALPICHNAQTV